MPWHPLPRIAFAVATYPFEATSPADLPLELGDELYIIEQGGRNGEWFRGYLVAPPSLLAGLTSTKGQTLEARVFSGIFPVSCVEVREVLGESERESEEAEEEEEKNEEEGHRQNGVVDSAVSSHRGSRRSAGDISNSNGSSPISPRKSKAGSTKSINGKISKSTKSKTKSLINGSSHLLSVPTKRDPDAPKAPAPVPMLKIGDENPTSASEPLVDEIASCLREWHSTNLHGLLLGRQYPLLDKMSSLVNRLDLSRRQFLHDVLTTQEMRKLREKTVWDLVRGNKLFNGEVIVRDPAQRGRVLTGDDSAVEITRLQSTMSLLDERPEPVATENLTLHHLLVDGKTFVGASAEPTTLVFSLATKSPGAPATALSESFIVDVPPSGVLTSLAKVGSMKTLFTGLAAADIGEAPSAETELYLVVKVRSAQQVTAGKPESRGHARENTAIGDKSQTSSGASRSGRRSLMWGQNSKRGFSRNAPLSKLDSLSEDDGSSASRGGPPSTAGSKASSSYEAKSGSVSRVVTRTIGIGALKLNSIMKQDEEVEQLVSIWSPSTGPSEKQEQGDGWEEVIRDLMGSKSGHYERSRRGERLQVHLQAFDSPDADDLIKSTPTFLSGATQTSKMGFSGAPTKPRSDIYITVDEAFLPRQALLSRPTGSATPLSSHLSCMNLQITLEVRRANGERIEKCIFASSNSEGESSWASTAAERGHAWNQVLRLSIPPIDVPSCHLVMVLADAPNQPLAICHMPLWDQGAFMRDGHHSLLLYRYDESTMHPKASGPGGAGYLDLGWNARGKDDVSKDEAVTGPVATLRVQTYLCSTRFSQDKVLLGLLKWREQGPGDVQDLLKRLTFVPEIEVVKLLSDVFDAIFGILVENSGNDDLEDLVFSALVTVLGIVHDRRFNLEPLVDQYAENKFNYPFATPCLVRSFSRLLQNPSEPQTSRKLRATFKVVRHILKFITHARDQQKAKEAGIGITSNSPGFSRDLRSIFKSLDSLMRSSAPILVGSQTLAVQHFHTWLPVLGGLLSTEEIMHIAIDFMDSCALVKGKLILYKLILIINFSRLSVFSDPARKASLSANTVRWIAPYWGKTEEVTEQWREQVRLCCSILSIHAGDLGPEVPSAIPKIVDSYLALQAVPKTPKTRLSLLFPTSYPFPSKPISERLEFDEALFELSAILSTLSTLPVGMQLDLPQDEMATLLEDMLHVHLSILQCDAFPSNWLSVHIYHHKSTMKALQYVAGILVDSFLPHPDDAEDYNTELWKAFFTVLLKLVSSDALALETFPEQKRRAVWKIAGDVREHGAELLRKTWEMIGWDTSPDELERYGMAKTGGYQVQYVPALVGPIAELCLSVHQGLRTVAVEVLQTMVVSEWTLSEDLSAIQTELIDCLDELFKSKPLTESILQKLFMNELLNLFEPLSQIPDDPLYAALKELVATIDEFLDLLVAVNSTDDTGEASHMIQRLRLMEFLRDMQKEEIFIRYVHQLAELQSNARNHTEAGLALHLHADLYEWDPTKIVPPLADPIFPAQSQFDRKERIYFEIIKHFEDGEAWSCALDAYQELQAQYQDNVFDLPKLARTQRAIATIYDRISKSDKLVPKYFRVVYKGMGFPPGLRDKEFVFEGSPTERSSAFTDRMQEQHPSAQIITNHGEIEDVEGQFLQISALSPHRDLEHHVFQRARVPPVVRDYLVTGGPQVFSVTSKRNTSGPVASHSAEKILYTTADTFPTILRRSEIVSTTRIPLDALHTAVERVIRKTQEMAVVEKRLVEGEEDMAPLLIEALSISVNPDSESSVARYRELLPRKVDDEGLEEEVELSPLENALKISLIDHAVLIRRCLNWFSKSSATGIQGVRKESREELQQSTSPFSFNVHPSLHHILTKALLDFEASFAPELSSFVFPQQTRSSTPAPSWSMVSLQERVASIPHSATIATVATTDTSILDPPAAKQVGHTRGLSFLKRFPEPLKDKPNGNTAQVRTRGLSETSSERGREKENGRSRVGANRLRMQYTEKEDDAEWVTSSDLSAVGEKGVGNGTLKRVGTDGSTTGSIGSRVGSVRKRLSMLKLGKKPSKSGVLVGSVMEEE
jgi:dedicator of cytokinesis protein 3